MKKLLLSITILIITVTLTGCFKRDDLEDVTIYTTVYPIEYITDNLYGNNSDVLSIYPNSINPSEYKLTEKQVNDYSKSAIFIYNGLSDEKKIAADFINHNKQIRIIDAAQGIDVNNSAEELWMSPANFLMMAQNVKNQLKEYITNKYVKEEVDENYENLKLTISEMDAELKIIAENANEKTLVVSSDLFKYLEKYGYEVISLENANNTTLNKVKNLFNNKKVSYIFMKENQEISDTITDLTNTYKAELVNVRSITNLSEEEKNNGETYATLMNTNIDLIKAEVYE